MPTTLSSRLNILSTPTEMLYRTTDNDPSKHLGKWAFRVRLTEKIHRRFIAICFSDAVSGQLRSFDASLKAGSQALAFSIDTLHWGLRGKEMVRYVSGILPRL
jgi:hypothetical protein